MNNLLFAAFAVVVLIGTVFPLFVQAIDHQQLTVGTPYYDSITVPLGFALLFFMAVGPALPWRKGTRRPAPAPAGGAGVVRRRRPVGLRPRRASGVSPRLAAFGLGAFAGRRLSASWRSASKPPTGRTRCMAGPRRPVERRA